MFSLFLLIFIGIFAGILGAVLGIGGGIIIVPILVIIMKIPIHEAIAASLIVITANSLSTSAAYIRSGLANLHLALGFACVSVLGALLGSYVSVSLSQKAVMLILGFMQILVAYLTYIRTKKVKNYVRADENNPKFFDGDYVEQSTGEHIKYTPVHLWANAIFAYFAGIFSGLTGVGGGILVIPGMNLISRIPIKASTATSGVLIGFSAVTGGIVYMRAGYLNYELVSTIILGVVIGTAISMKFFAKITDKKVSYLFIILLLFVSVQMIYRGLGL